MGSVSFQFRPAHILFKMRSRCISSFNGCYDGYVLMIEKRIQLNAYNVIANVHFGWLNFGILKADAIGMI